MTEQNQRACSLKSGYKRNWMKLKSLKRNTFMKCDSTNIYSLFFSCRLLQYLPEPLVPLQTKKYNGKRK
jgi:hypothetical protein